MQFHFARFPSMMSDSTHTTSYSKQHRGSSASYEKYFAGMDASVQQKVALTTAHFPVRGRIADMGSGSGRGTFDLACLYQNLELIGVDINPVAIAHSAAEYQRQNLRYKVGDISLKVFADDSLDGILNSSVLHHVTSFNNFDVRRVFATLDNQVAQLKMGGVIIIRDFLVPGDGTETVLLDLPETDGVADGSIEDLSTSALFERFARDWRSSLNRHASVSFDRLEPERAGFARYRVSLRVAAEFVLRKDYRADWDTELLEEYTYFTQTEFEQAFRGRGLRIVTSMPLWNPWIVQNRFEGRFFLCDVNGNPLPFPPTNYLIVGEKVNAEAGVEIREVRQRNLDAPHFLTVSFHRHKESGYIYELAERPNLTVDLLPFYSTSEGRIFILAKKDFPRPIVNACMDHPSLSGSHLSGFITEPISQIVESSVASDEIVRRILLERASLPADEIKNISPPFAYYTSPGGINERVTARLVELRPPQSREVREPTPIPNYTKFSDAVTVRELDAYQTLRACHVGGMFDARLEINIYHLLRSLGVTPGQWIGAPIELKMQNFRVTSSADDDVDSLLLSTHAAFEICQDANLASQFLSLREGLFTEHKRDGGVLASASFEYVVPRELSKNTIIALPVVQTGEGIFVGIELRDLPAVQSFTGSSRVAVAPAWRLPGSIKNRTESALFLTEAMRCDFGANVRRLWELGGSYFPTPGVTPEIAHPFAVEIEAADAVTSNLSFIETRQLAAKVSLVRDAHLLIAAYRLLHALGILNQ